jgi:hypothetical protein
VRGRTAKPDTAVGVLDVFNFLVDRSDAIVGELISFTETVDELECRLEVGWISRNFGRGGTVASLGKPRVVAFTVGGEPRRRATGYTSSTTIG